MYVLNVSIYLFSRFHLQNFRLFSPHHDAVAYDVARYESNELWANAFQ